MHWQECKCIGSLKRKLTSVLTVPQSKAYKMTPQLQISTSGPAYNLNNNKHNTCNYQIQDIHTSIKYEKIMSDYTL